MAYGLNTETVITDFGGTAADSFGNLRVAKEFSIADYKQIFDKNIQFFDESLTGATSTFITNGSKVRLQCTAINQSAIRQTYLLHPYQPGKGLGFKITGVLYSASNANYYSELGLLDNENGIGFYYDGTTVGVLIRSFVSGVAVDTKIPRASWSENTCDDIDFTKTQIFRASGQWLGVGTVTFSIVHNGVIRIVHQEHHNNLITDVYCTTLSLPIRYKCSTDGSFSGSIFTDCICAEVFSQGGYNPTGDLRVVDRGITPLTVTTTETCILAVRAKSGFKLNLLPTSVDLVSSTADNVLYRIYIGGTVTGGAWVNVGPTNRSEYNVTATSFTGTNLIISTYSSDQIREAIKEFKLKETAGISIDGTQQPIIITARNLTGTAGILTSLHFKEIY